MRCPDCGRPTLRREDGLVFCALEECGYERQGDDYHDHLALERGEDVPPPEPLDWRSELEAIAPVTAEERLQDRMQRTRYRIASLNQAAADTHQDDAAIYLLGAQAPPWMPRLTQADLDALEAPRVFLPFPRYQPPVRPRPRLSWWRRLALVLLGGEA